MQRRFKITIFILLTLAYAYIAFVVLTPQNAWVNPEVPHFDKFTIYNTRSIFEKTFNWEAYEFAPRVTRPLANFVQIIEGLERYWIRDTLLPYLPSFSPTEFFICLILLPLLMFKILELLGANRLTCWLGFLMALTIPSTLSHLSFYFRPAKAMSELFFLGMIYVLLKYKDTLRTSRKHLALLFACMILGFLSDEWGLMAYLYLFLHFLSNPRKHWRTLAPALIGIPVFIGILDILILPKLSEELWYLHGGMHNYFIFDPFLRGSDPWGAVLDQLQKIGDLIADHALSFSTETFGMFWNSPPEGWIWYIFQLQKIVFVAALASAAYVFVTKTDIQRRKSIGFFFTAAVVAILLHSLMMSLTSMTFGPYYYAGQISLLMVITFALAIDRIQPWLAVTAVTLCTVTTAYAFPFTNQAMKHFHHYPRGNPDFQKMFQGDLNRFTLKSPVFDNLQILLTMRDLKMGECTDVPNELVWYMTSLGYRIDTDFPYQTAVVKLCRESTAGAIVN